MGRIALLLWCTLIAYVKAQCISWIDNESTSSNQLPQYPFGSSCSSKNIFLGVHFEEGIKSWGVWKVTKWESAWEKTVKPWKSKGFLGNCDMNGLFKDSSKNLPWQTNRCAMKYSTGFDLDRQVKNGGNFRASKTGWKWAKFTACCGTGEVTWHVDKGDTYCGQTCAKRDLHCVDNVPGWHSATQMNAIVKETKLASGFTCSAVSAGGANYNPARTVSNGYCYYKKNINYGKSRCTDEKVNASSYNLFCACSIDSSYSVTLYNNMAWAQNRDDIDWINSMLPSGRFMGTLCYRMTKNGYSQATFRTLCATKGDFVVAIRTRRGHIFGAYSGRPWDKTSTSYQYCPKDRPCFLWQLTTWSAKYNKYKYVNYRYPQYATYQHTSYGPCFGNGHDLCISSPSSPAGYTNPNNAFKSPNSSTYYMDISSSSSFYMLDWEVFLIKTTDSPTSSPTVVPCGDGTDKRETCELFNDLGDKKNAAKDARNAIGVCEEDPTVIMLLRDDRSWVFVTETPEQAYDKMVQFLRDQHLFISNKHPLEISYPYKTRDGKSRKFLVASDMDLWSAIQLQRNFDTINLYIEITSAAPTADPTTGTPTKAPTDTDAPTGAPTYSIDTGVFTREDDIAWLVAQLKSRKNVKIGSLLYRMSKHGKAASNFHKYVDGKGKHTCIVRRDKVDNDQVFGSYADMSWASSGSYKYCNGCFLFIVRDGKYTKFISTIRRYANYGVYFTSGYGPCFGGGHDYCINSPSTPYGYTSQGHTWNAPNGGYPYYYGGSSTFYIKDWECFATPSLSG